MQVNACTRQNRTALTFLWPGRRREPSILSPSRTWCFLNHQLHAFYYCCISPTERTTAIPSMHLSAPAYKADRLSWWRHRVRYNTIWCTQLLQRGTSAHAGRANFGPVKRLQAYAVQPPALQPLQQLSRRQKPLCWRNQNRRWPLNINPYENRFSTNAHRIHINIVLCVCIADGDWVTVVRNKLRIRILTVFIHILIAKT